MEVQRIPKLTKGNQLTISRLKNNDFSSLSQLNVTTTMKKVLDSKTLSEEIIPKIIKYEQVKNPTKDLKWIETYLSRKITSKDDRKMFREVLSKGDYSSFPSTDKPKNLPSGNLPSGNLPSGNLPSGDFSVSKTTKTTKGSKSDLNSVLETVPFQGTGTKLSDNEIDWGSVLQGSSKYLADNKKTIDVLKKAISKKSISDGSWLTQIASLKAPQVAVIQELLKGSPLGMNKDDNEKLDKILNGEDVDGGLRVILKSLVNPDSVGRIISTQTGKIAKDTGDALSEFYRKLTGGAEKVPDKTDYEKTTEAVVADRKATQAREAEKKAYLEKVGVTIKGDGMDRRANADSTSSDLAPVVGGVKPKTTALEDVGIFLSDLFLTGGRARASAEDRSTPEKQIAWLEKNDPSAFNAYQQKLREYINQNKKLNLTYDSEVDASLNDNEILRLKKYTRTLLEKASSLGELTDQQKESMYDISSTLQDVMDGKVKISYRQMDDLTRQIMKQVSDKVINLPEVGTDAFIKSQSDGLGAKTVDDSSLTNIKTRNDFDREQKVKAEAGDETGETEDKDNPDEMPPLEDVKETMIKDLSSTEDTPETNWSELRPRLDWGGTDELLKVSYQNFILQELMSIQLGNQQPGWGRGTDNLAYQANQREYNLRFKKAFPLPKSNPVIAPVSENNFTRSNYPLFHPAVPEAPIQRDFQDLYGRDAFYQFTPLSEKDQTGPIQQFEHKAYQQFPDMRNEMAGERGEIQQARAYSYIQNNRFTRR